MRKIFVLLLLVILVSGCGKEKIEVQKEMPIETQKETIEAEEKITSELKRCSELNGDKCEAGEECEGNWLDAIDSLSCCSIKCSKINKDILEIETFEITPENQNLGDVT